MGRGLSWRPWEDKALARAWIQCSEGTVDGAEQTSDAFYARVGEVYTEIVPKGAAQRTAKSCKCQFGTISKEVQRFAGCYKRLKREKQSGKTEQDLIEDATRLYYNLEEGMPEKPFPFLEA